LSTIETAPRLPGTLVVGLGNPLMTDDGIGLAALERLRAEWLLPDTVELLDGGTWGMNLMPVFESAVDLILLDAVRAGGAPGTLVELEDAAIPRGLALKLSPHQIDVREVLALLALRDTTPARMLVLGMEPDRIEMGTDLSETAERALPALVAQVVRHLEARGHRCQRLAEPACTS